MPKKQETNNRKQYFVVLWRAEDQARLKGWWQTLQEYPGERAQLRRCETPSDVLVQRGFHRISRSFPWWNKQDDDVLALATVAGVLSHVKSEYPHFFPAQLGQEKDNNGKPLMSELRFQQLLASQNWEEFYSNFRRAVQLAGYAANILSIADGIFLWARDKKNLLKENPRKRFSFLWADAYYGELLKYKKETRS